MFNPFFRFGGKNAMWQFSLNLQRTLPCVQRPTALAATTVVSALACGIPMWSGMVMLTTLPGQAYAQSHNAASASNNLREYQIPAGDLTAALQQFGQQAGILLSYSTAQTRGQQSPGIRGRYTVDQALEHLLGTSNLQAQPAGGGYTLFPAPRRSTPESSTGMVQLPEVMVKADAWNGTTEGTGSYTQAGPSGAATGLSLTLRETPQSLTVMTRQRMEDFKLETLTDVMEQTPGITVQRQGSHVGFSARGTSVNLQTEGNQQLTHGYTYFASTNFTLDSMVDVDRIEVLKGSNGLLVGKGNTGATVNMIRKRPTREFQARVSASAGSWNNYSANADVGGSLNEAGTLRGRVAAAVADGDSFRDYETNKSRTVYGTVEVDLTPDTLLSTGLTYRKRDVRGLAMWTNIVAYEISDPSQFLGWKPRSYNPGVSWSGYQQESTNVFARLEHQFANGWTSKVQLAHENIEMPELLLASAGGDFETATRYLDTENRNSSIIADLKGPVQLFGRTHDVLLGAGASNASSNFDSNKFGESHHYQKQRYAYVTSRINLADPLKVIVGTRITNYENQNKTLYGGSNLKETGVVTPYVGLVFDASKNISLYGSYASIFQPQSNQDEQGRVLDPREGLSYEIGAKGEFFDKRLNASISHFWIRTNNEPEATGGRTPSGGTAYQAVMGASRRGYELELSGELARGWQVQGGYTMNSSNLTNAGSDPKYQFKLGSTYRFANDHLQGLTVGASTRWQSTTTATSASFAGSKVQQPSYWLVDLMARYQVNKQLSVSANINNVFDKKYFAYVIAGYQGLGYTWGAPRSVNVSARYDF